VVFKLDIPTEALMSENRRDLFKLLQEIAAQVEQSAIKMGYANAKGFAGGSCKPLFCQDLAECPVLKNGEACLYPLSARPSMSGFGINVSGLMKAAGWSMQRITRETDPEAVSMGMLCGLVLLG
jgi:predicted metal-binding protein